MSCESNHLFDLTGKTAIVTGGGSGIGREICDALAEFGADVACLDIHKDRAEETCEIMKKYGHKSLALAVDVSKYEEVRDSFQQVKAEFGKLDILVNNAGIGPPSVLIDETDLTDWHRVIDINLHGVFYCMKEGLRIMRQQRSGSVINIGSMLGISATDPEVLAQSPYVTAKHGVIGLTKQGAAEYGQFNIRVNCVAPGFHTGTRISETLKIKPNAEEAQTRKQMISSRTPLGRMAEAKELKGLLIYLASDSSAFTTGATIVSDGGWTVW